MIPLNLRLLHLSPIAPPFLQCFIKEEVPLAYFEADTRHVHASRLNAASAIAHSLTILGLFLLSGAASAETLRGKIVGVTDGDTVTLRTDWDTYQVRVAGIDAPEKRQPFGSVSKKALSDCAFGQTVEVDTHKKDRYGRLIGKINSNGADCGLRQIQLGLAWHYKAYAKEQPAPDRESYSQAELVAREQRLGLWRDPNPTPPWDFRKESKSNSRPAP